MIFQKIYLSSFKEHIFSITLYKLGRLILSWFILSHVPSLLIVKFKLGKWYDCPTRLANNNIYKSQESLFNLQGQYRIWGNLFLVPAGKKPYGKLLTLYGTNCFQFKRAKQLFLVINQIYSSESGVFVCLSRWMVSGRVGRREAVVITGTPTPTTPSTSSDWTTATQTTTYCWSC